MNVKVRFIRPAKGYAKGEIVEVDPGVADAFVNWSYVAEYIEEPKPSESPAEASSTANPEIENSTL